ncbi:peroxiredoxin [Kurthia sp. 3B1D]|uniref:Peroxiredoxin n=2 Tax=Kurthia TaxID=1649 RepID=A0A433RVY5_9BACL|nr:OsmC family protein [Kurthia sp. 3B1D]RUS57452.1 peroxiredoxin [Kurthia sp. 3B1D]HIX41876.1 OsmC family protein [Candidatus Kurthia intestinigallinarum]
MAKTTVKAQAHLQDNYRVEVSARSHKLIIDEPERLGGTDEGPNPVEVLLGAFGACHSIVARTYAKKFDIDLQDFWVELEGDFDTDGFLGKSDVRPGFSDIRYTFHLQTTASDEQVQAFIAYIEAHCPIGDTLANLVNVSLAGYVIEQTV